jgi:hypothetical protein
MLPMFNPYGVGWSWGCRVFATDIQSLRDFFRLLLHLICRCAFNCINLKARFKLATCLITAKQKISATIWIIEHK